MKKALALTITMLLLSITVASTLQQIRAETRTIIVPDDYSTITEAINNALDEDTVHAVEAKQGLVSATVTINPDGSITGTGIQRNGDVYTLTDNISGGIQVQKSYVVIDGAGFTIEGNSQYVRGIDLSNGVGQDPTNSMINNITVQKLRIMNCGYAIDNSNTYNNTFIGNYISNCDTGFWITGSSNNTLMYNTVKDCVTGISINYAGLNIITQNNIINNSLLVWLSTEPTVDQNYWSDYITKYPNAKEIEKSGLPNLVWDTPYNYGGSLGNFTDKHPLIDPVVVPTFPIPSYSPSPSPTSNPTPTPTIPEYPTHILLTLIILTTIAMICIIVKKSSNTPKTLNE